jgi:hypothetical protein
MHGDKLDRNSVKLHHKDFNHFFVCNEVIWSDVLEVISIVNARPTAQETCSSDAYEYSFAPCLSKLSKPEPPLSLPSILPSCSVARSQVWIVEVVTFCVVILLAGFASRLTIHLLKP